MQLQALSAGGDVKAVASAAIKEGDFMAGVDFFRSEYLLHCLIHALAHGDAAVLAAFAQREPSRPASTRGVQRATLVM